MVRYIILKILKPLIMKNMIMLMIKMVHITFQAWLSGFLNFIYMVHCGVFLYENQQMTSSNYQEF